MRKAKLLVIKKDYIGDQVIENVIGYTLDSIFAEHDDILSVNLNMDSYDSIVHDFYNTQANINMSKRRRLFHFIISTPLAKDMERTLTEGAECLVEYFEKLGHQALLVPHCSSSHNYLNYHWHIAVNAVSSINGKSLTDKYEIYNDIINYLNANTYAEWSWYYKKPF